jgi:uncharacterized protein YuzE
MKDVYLEITFRKGKAIAAYIYLSRKPGVTTNMSKKIKDNIIADYDGEGGLIGLEITSPHKANSADINDILVSHNAQPFSEKELAPLKAA